MLTCLKELVTLVVQFQFQKIAE